jgi:hypothetical protein
MQFEVAAIDSAKLDNDRIPFAILADFAEPRHA